MTVLALPSGVIPNSVTWSLEHNVGSDAGPLGNTVQRIQRDGGRWRADVTFPTLDQENGSLLAAYLDKASRGDMWTYITPPHNDARGNWGPDELVVNGGFTDDTKNWSAGSGAALNVNARRLRVKVGGSPGAVAIATQTGLATEADQPHVVMVDLVKGSTANWRVKLYPSGSPSQDEHVSYYEDEGRVIFTHLPETTSTTIELACNSTTEQDYSYFANVSMARCLLVNDPLAVGNECDVKGGPTSTNGALKAGDFVTIQLWNGWQMVRLTEDLDTDSSGNGTIRFEPSLRDGVKGGGAVVVHKPFCRMMIPAHASPHAVSLPRLHGFSVSYLEDVTEIGITENPQDTDLIWYWDAHSYGLAPIIGTGTTTIANGAKTYFDKNGLLKTTELDASATGSPTPYKPAFDHDPLTGALKGQLLEGSRTNEALWSRDLTRSAWTASNVTAALDQTGEDGVADSCSSVLATAAGGKITQSIASSGSARTLGVSLKRLLGSGTIEITLDNVVWLDVTASVVADRFTRVYHYATHANPVIGIRLGTSGDKVAVDYVQEEAAEFQSSRVLTTTAAAARAADVDNLSTINVQQWSDEHCVEVEFLLDHVEPNALSNRFVYQSDDVSGPTEAVRIRTSTGAPDVDAIVVDGGSTQATLDGDGPLSGASFRAALRVKANDFAFSTNGGAVVKDGAGTVPTTTTIRKGSGTGTNTYLFGHLRRLAILKSGKPDRQIRSLSA